MIVINNKIMIIFEKNLKINQNKKYNKNLKFFGDTNTIRCKKMILFVKCSIKNRIQAEFKI